MSDEYKAESNKIDLAERHQLALNYGIDGLSRKKDIPKKISLLQSLAKEGYAPAQMDLAECYFEGAGVKKDYREAVYLYRLAAEQGDYIAQFRLGYFYRDGPEKDHKEAVRLFQLAASHGYAPAQNSLGICYASGESVEKDLKEALRLFRLAASQGYAQAQNNLGHSFRHGLGVEKDLKEAVRFYRLAAEQGETNAQVALGELYEEGAGVERNIDKAIFSYKLAAKEGHPQAQAHLAKCYSFGKGSLKMNETEAIRLYRLAAEQGHDQAKLEIALIYLKWLPNKIDRNKKEEAIRLLRSIVNQEPPSVKYALGLYHASEQDYLLAAKLYREAFEKGDSKAICRLWDFDFQKRLRQEECRLSILNEEFPTNENVKLIEDIRENLEYIKKLEVKSGRRGAYVSDRSGQYNYDGGDWVIQQIRRDSTHFRENLPIIVTFIAFIPTDCLAIIASYMNTDTPQPKSTYVEPAKEPHSQCIMM